MPTKVNVTKHNMARVTRRSFNCSQKVELGIQILQWACRAGSEKAEGQAPDTFWTCSEAAKGPWLVHPEARESPAFNLRGETRAWTMAKCAAHLCWDSTEPPGKEQPRLLLALGAEWGKQAVITALDCAWTGAVRWKALHYNPLKECAFHLRNGCAQGQKEFLSI